MSSPFVWFHHNGKKPNETRLFLESLLGVQSSDGPGGTQMLVMSASPFAALGSAEDDVATDRAVGLGAALALWEKA